MPTPAAWTVARHPLPADPPVGAVAGDGALVQYQEVGDATRIIYVDAKGRRTRIPFDGPVPTIVPEGLAIFGDHVVVGVQRSDDYGDWALYVWDARRGGTAELVGSRDPKAPGAGFFFFRSDGRYLAWLNPTPSGATQVMVHTFATGRTRVVATGKSGVPEVVDGTLVWVQETADGSSVGLHAVDADTLEPVALPPVVAAAQTVVFASDGRAWAWLSADRETLWAWQPGVPAPRRVATARLGSLDWPHVSNGIVTWIDGRIYAADLRSGSYTPMNKGPGSSYSVDDALWINTREGGFFVRTANLPPLPSCP